VETAGRGIKAKVDGATILVGRAQWLKDSGITEDLMKSVDLNETEGWSLIFVARNGRCIGWVGLQDQTRAEARQSLAELKHIGVRRIAMVSGDRQPVAVRVAKEIGCEEVAGDCLPQNKVEFVRTIKGKGARRRGGRRRRRRAGIGCGRHGHRHGRCRERGRDSQRHHRLMNSDLRRLPVLLRLSRQTRSVINQNF
jgi:Cd2+/Zn2+-exporting ATPase